MIAWIIIVVIILIIVIAMLAVSHTGIASMAGGAENIYHTLEYPAASSLVEWLLPKLKQHKIPYRNYKTDGDYYKISVGTSTPIQMDWKHLDISEIKAFSDAMKPYGYKIKCQGPAWAYEVLFIKIGDQDTGRDYRAVYNKLEDDIWKESFADTSANGSYTAVEIIDAIKNYVQSLSKAKKNKWIFEKIMKAPKLTGNRVYDHMPGTGKATEQFYKFAKAIACGAITDKDMKLEDLKMMIRTYVFDQME
jgi:hypothetical protein